MGVTHPALVYSGYIRINEQQTNRKRASTIASIIDVRIRSPNWGLCLASICVSLRVKEDSFKMLKCFHVYNVFHCGVPWSYGEFGMGLK